MASLTRVLTELHRPVSGEKRSGFSRTCSNARKHLCVSVTTHRRSTVVLVYMTNDRESNEALLPVHPALAWWLAEKGLREIYTAPHMVMIAVVILSLQEPAETSDTFSLCDQREAATFAGRCCRGPRLRGKQMYLHRRILKISLSRRISGSIIVILFERFKPVVNC